MRKFLNKISSLISLYLTTAFTAGISFYNCFEYRNTGIIKTAHGQYAKGGNATFITYGLLICTFVLVTVSIYKTFKAITAQNETENNYKNNS